MTSLAIRTITFGEYKEISGGLYQTGVFGPENRPLLPQEIASKYDSRNDIFVSHDWGRELGVDNHARVVEAGRLLKKRGLRANLDVFGLLGNGEIKTSIEGSHCAIVFVTRRYVRRYAEMHYISEEYDYVAKILGYSKMIFVIMEKRMATKSRWTEQLKIPADEVENLHVLNMYIEDGTDMLIADIDRLYEKAMEIVGVTVDALVQRLYMSSYQDIFTAVKSCPASALTEFIAQCPCSEDVLRFRDDEGCTLLYQASASGNADTVQALLQALAARVKDHKSIVDLANKHGCTALFAASSRGHVKVVELLLQASADPDKYTQEGHSPLYEAALNGHLQVIQLLINAKADINLADTNGLLPSDVAANAEISSMLSAITATHKKLLAIALADNNVEKLHTLLEKHPNVNVNFEDEDGRTALFLAASAGHADMVRALLEAKADVLLRDNWLDTPLAVATFYCQDATIVRLLLDAKSDINSKNAWGNSALHNNLSRSQPSSEKTEIVELLLLHGANVNDVGVCEGWTCTPLQLALKKGRYGDVQQLLEAGAVLDDASASQLLSEHDRFFPATVSAEQCFFSLKALSARDYAVWFKLLQLRPGSAIEDSHLQAFVLAHVKAYPHLASAKDEHGRVAVDVATKANKAAINSHFLWHGRFRIIEQHPEHVSATCYVYRALDETVLDEAGHPLKVALKLIRLKSHFIRELESRRENLDPDYIVSILDTFPAVDPSLADLDAALAYRSDDCFTSADLSPPDDATDAAALRRLRNGETIPQLSKYVAELMFCIVMPLADRNMFVCLKQERFAGKEENIDEISYVFLQLVRCVEHMHQKSIIHADIKTLNMVRSGVAWRLIDLDAACKIGVHSVGFKSSSAYIPPEAVYANAELGRAVVRSAANLAAFEEKHHVSFPLLVAHPSFDVWSLGCILYQMCTPDVRPLFQGGQDDNLTDNAADLDNNLFALADWTEELKTRKLATVISPLARNLLSQMLHKDPAKRPTISRVLSHPFLSKKQYTRMVGESAEFDVFISYRVASDVQHAELLYELLTEAGVKVWWDKRCLKAGVNWEQGFCSGLVSSRYFVCILSRGAINAEGNKRQNFGLLEEDSPCDNVLLELRLALELQELGLIEKVFPVLIGDKSSTGEGSEDGEQAKYANFFASGCMPSTLPEVPVRAVERNVLLHLEEQGLGSPVVLQNSVKGTINAVLKCNGAIIEGEAEKAFAEAVEYLLSDQRPAPAITSPGRALSRKFSSKPAAATADKTREARTGVGAGTTSPLPIPAPGGREGEAGASKVLRIREVTASAAHSGGVVAELRSEAALLLEEIARLQSLYEANLELQKLSAAAPSAAAPGSSASP